MAGAAGASAGTKPGVPLLARQLSEEYAACLCSSVPLLPSTPRSFDRPSNEVYKRARDAEDRVLPSPSLYAAERAALDPTWHTQYTLEREAQQDAIVAAFLQPAELAAAAAARESADTLEQPNRPWLVLTGGAMGAGKGFVVRYLGTHGVLALGRFVVCDGDKIKACMPDTAGYAAVNPATAASMVHAESATISEIVMRAAVRRGLPVLVDTSLRYYEWFSEYLATVRRDYPAYRLALIVVTAPLDVIRARAERRGATTRRVVPHWLLEASYAAVEPAFVRLSPDMDVAVRIDNSKDGVEPQPPEAVEQLRAALHDVRE